MYNNNKVAVIVAAAGKGSRIGGPVPKQFLEMAGEPVLIRTLRAFSSLKEIDHIFVVTGESYISHCEKIIKENSISKVRAVVKGGAERQDSVYNALRRTAADTADIEYVLIHDGARPFVSRDVILDVLKAASETGAAVAGVPMKDSIRQMTQEPSEGSRSVDRSRYVAVQTPQGFRLSYIMDAYERAYKEGFYGTDDAVLAERAGYRVAIARGDYANIKITTREDLPMENRVGTGFDVHAFEEGRELVLGGVKIPYEKGLAGHSDADVLIHALMDSLLGAAALGDIGRHFPDTDSRYLGISSMILLQKVGDILFQKAYHVGNIDVTVMAQAPKISPYIEQMRENIAEALGIEKDRISIKGTTTERLGFVGRKEGIAAEAVCFIYR